MTIEDVIGCKLKVVNPNEDHKEFLNVVGEWVINYDNAAFYMKWYTNDGKDLNVGAFYPKEVEIVEQGNREEAIEKTNLLAHTAQALLEELGYYSKCEEDEDNENA